MAPGSASNGARAPATTTAFPTASSRTPVSQLAQNVVGPAPVSDQPTSSNVTTSINANQNAHSTAQLVPVSIIGPGSDPSPTAMSDSRLDSDDSQQQMLGQPYKDGRIRNPVPSKLKGKTSITSGEFSVMHMDIKAGKDVAADRDAAAKRTSENTALAAKMAYESGYQPHRKSNWLRVPEESNSSTPDPSVPFTGTTPYDHALYGLPQPASTSPREKPVQLPMRALTAAECKEEQARLLTLLRTLQPVAVVDQRTFKPFIRLRIPPSPASLGAHYLCMNMGLTFPPTVRTTMLLIHEVLTLKTHSVCKALAYFGGVPEAPPPQDGKFPDSAEANGPGSVFVGWIAEIFPDLDSQGQRKPRPVLAAPDPPPAPTVEKRGRGRPKGSKASKFRSDKGVKKGPKKNMLADGLDVNGNEHDGSWVDVDDTVMDDSRDVVITGAREAHPARPTPESQSIAEMRPQTQVQDSGKKRGRPKGSKNRPKDPTAIPVPELSVPHNPAALSALFSLGKTGGKVKKPKKKDLQAINGAVPTVNGPVTSDSLLSQAPLPVPVAPGADRHQHQDGADFHLATLKAYNESQQPGPQASSFHSVNNPSEPSQPVVPMLTAQPQPKKRKRNGKDSENASQPAPTAPMANNGIINTAMPPTVQQAPMAPIAMTTTPVQALPPAVPASKRQKKFKAKTATTNPEMPEQVVAATAHSSTGQQQTMIPATRTQISESQMYTSPTIEELEAQLEQHDQSSLRNSQVTSTPVNRPAQQAPMQQAPMEQPQPQMGMNQVQQISLSKQVQQAQQKGDQRSMARQRQQQAGARTASPNVNPNVNSMRTASPHIGTQSASPNIHQAQAASPSLQHQRATNSQTPTSMAAQMQNQQARNTQSYYTQQSTSTQSPYAQQQSQQYAAAQPSSPPGKQQFNVSQSQQQSHAYSSTPQSSHTPNYAPQQHQQPQQSQQSQQQHTQHSQQPQQQYSQTKQQTYSAQPQQQYASPVQQYSTQQRAQQQQHQQYATTSTATPSQSLPAQSPQYGTSNTSAYHSSDGHFRTNSAASMGFGSYGSNATSTAPRSNNLYSTSTTNSYGPSNQQISSYSTSANRRANLPTTTTATIHNSVQSIPQNLGFGSADFDNLGFDGNLMSGLDNSTGNHSSLGLNASPYNMAGTGTGNHVSRASAGAAANTFTTNLNNFDSTTLRNDGYNFGLRR